LERTCSSGSTPRATSPVAPVTRTTDMCPPLRDEARARCRSPSGFGLPAEKSTSPPRKLTSPPLGRTPGEPYPPAGVAEDSGKGRTGQDRCGQGGGGQGGSRQDRGGQGGG
jgi:hypothetical protein